MRYYAALGDDGALRYCVITKSGSTYTVTREPSGEGGDADTFTHWSNLSANDAAAWLAETFVLGVPKARVNEQRWSKSVIASLDIAENIDWPTAKALGMTIGREN